MNEWAVQTRVIVDGPFEWTETNENLRPHTEETARAKVRGLNKWRPGIARVVRREVSPWRPPVNDLCVWRIDDGDHVHDEQLPHDFSGDGQTCVNCFIQEPDVEESDRG